MSKLITVPLTLVKSFCVLTLNCQKDTKAKKTEKQIKYYFCFIVSAMNVNQIYRFSSNRQTFLNFFTGYSNICLLTYYQFSNE
jgi:hypothetical protein